MCGILYQIPTMKHVYKAMSKCNQQFSFYLINYIIHVFKKLLRILFFLVRRSSFVYQTFRITICKFDALYFVWYLFEMIELTIDPLYVVWYLFKGLPGVEQPGVEERDWEPEMLYLNPTFHFITYYFSCILHLFLSVDLQYRVINFLIQIILGKCIKMAGISFFIISRLIMSRIC